MGSRVLFVCTKNAVRSPMAKAVAEMLLNQNAIRDIHIDSAGIDPGNVDGFAIAAMAELNINIQSHEAKDLQDFDADDFDILIALSTAATLFAQETYGGTHVEVWDVGDPSLVEGNRDQRLEAYRAVRTTLEEKIRQRFSL